MRRLWVVGLVMWAGVRSRMEYRVDFLTRVAMGVIWNLASLVFIWAVVARFQGLAGWSQAEVFLVYTLRLLAHGAYCLLFHNTTILSRYVRRGEFDRILLRPMNPLVQLVTLEYDPAGIGDFGLGLVCLAVASRLLDVQWTFTAVLFLLLVVAGGCLIELSLYIMVNTLAFWFVDVEGLAWVVLTFSDNFALYPLNIFNTALQYLMTFILPVAFMSYYPATALLNRTGDTLFAPVLAYLTPVVGLVLFVIAYSFWRVGINHYQSTGS